MMFDAEGTPEERELDRALRPATFDDFVGQDTVREDLRIAIQAARQRREPLDHVLFAGPPGLGKTTLAHLIAAGMETRIVVTSGPALVAPRDLVGPLSRLERGDVLFVDEIHRMPRVVEEYLYSAMEDSAVDIVIDSGPSGRTVRLAIEPFTLIGATTREGLLTAAFRSRFGLVERLEPYPPHELREIVERAAPRLGIGFSRTAAELVADRARGVPRIALRIQRRVRDLAQVRGMDAVDVEVARAALERLRIDELGLEDVDRKLLRALIERGEPVGLKTLAAMVDEAEDTIEDVFEPHLLRCGLLARTPRGRVATLRAYRHLGLEPPAASGPLAGELPFADDAGAP
ncbi:MAG: Holliday junction branch migration DNA helicase RuvB [Planctomycetes bacterium]|nr:Holliday junction branch migration DNA helicase RuvB [Planctomycetota bacterium]